MAKANLKAPAIETSTLRPGLLVSMKTSVRGNVQYSRQELESKDGYSKWETERTVHDPKEQEAAIKARRRALFEVTRVCSASAFGLMCPEDKEDLLAAAIINARRAVEEFNATAKLTRISVYVITGRIAQDDVEAVRAINSEVRELLDDMKDGLERLDVKTVRDAAAKARSVGAMLTPEAQVRIQLAIDAARAVAKDIVKAGDRGAIEIDKWALKKIAESRTAFIDLSDAKEVAKPKQSARALDLKPAAAEKPKAKPKAQSRAVELR